MQYWFTADLHLGHTNIIDFCDRPFKNTTYMNEALIRNWNARVKTGDIVFHLGDFGHGTSRTDITKFIQRLNGNKIFIQGNHDKNNGVPAIIQDIRINYGGKDLLLIHRYEEAGPGYFLVLCGHVHQHWKFKTVEFFEYNFDVCNVGVDVWRFMPININEILSGYARWKKLNDQSNNVRSSN
jgi:calcineurin-like phosphoesterase family protein